jgi:DNA-binding protein H-NS
MSIDLKSLNARQLQKLIDEARRERQRQQKRAPIAKVRSKLTRMAAAEGYSLVELFGVKAGAKPVAARPVRAAKDKAGTGRRSTKGSTVPPKYRNPENPAETWSGRGKHPRWMASAIAGGKKPEDFLI